MKNRTPAFYRHLASSAEQRSQSLWRGRTQDQPTEGDFTDVYDRIRGNWDETTLAVSTRGLQARVRPKWLGDLFTLEVIPLEPFPTTAPTYSNTPYHISLDEKRDDKQQRALISQINDRYMSAPALTLIGTVEGAAFRLDRDRCPVGSDPAVQKLHDGIYEKLGHAGKYCNRPIHVSL